MTDFLFAALPWIALGAAIIVTIVNFNKLEGRQYASKKAGAYGHEAPEMSKKKMEDDFLSYGLSIGMGLGVLIGSSLMGIYGIRALTYSLCFGILAGVVAGSILSSYICASGQPPEALNDQK